VALLGKATKYLGAVANHKLDQGADPRIQIEQAVTEAQRRHSELAEHAAQVIGAHHQIQLQLARAQSDAQRLQSEPGRPWSWPIRRAPTAMLSRPPATSRPLPCWPRNWSPPSPRWRR